MFLSGSGVSASIPCVNLPSTIDRYEIRKLMGTGAMGGVYEAWDPKLHRLVAMKILKKEVADDPKVRERFALEARAVAALRHPNIVDIYDYSGGDSEFLYIVMEKLEGDDLFNVVADNGPMPGPAVAAVGHDLCLALQVAHDAGIIHRDLKPENVFISPNGRIVLTDFGIVKAVTENSALGGFTHSTEIIGTPGFMPPELMMNKPLGPYTDVFALAALLYNVATGEMPYDGAGPVEIFKTMMKGEYPDPSTINDSVDPEFSALLKRALEPKPKKRLQTVEELRAGLKSVLASHGVSDLREDIREYMRDADAYKEHARRRTTEHLLQQIKIATKDKDPVSVKRLSERLNALDPQNAELATISGILQLTAEEQASLERTIVDLRVAPPLPDPQPEPEHVTVVAPMPVPPGRWRWAIAAGIGVVVAAALLFAWLS